MATPRTRLRSPLLAVLLALALLGAACGGGDDTADASGTKASTSDTAVDVEKGDEEATTTSSTSATLADAGDGSTSAAATAVPLRGVSRVVRPEQEEQAPVTLRLGFFPNLTHAGAIVAVEGGILKDALGKNKLETSLFNAGPAASEALLAGAIDATYIGPNPAINTFVKCKCIKIVSGLASGGASLVVKPSVNSAEDLKGKKVATPQLGNTQDVALRAWLKGKGLSTDTSGGGDVSITPQENAQTLETFKAGTIEAAWVPEPWATRLVQEGGGKILLDERELWPDGDFVTTHLIVRNEFLDEHPDVIAQLLEGQLRANEFIVAKPGEGKALANRGIEKATGRALPARVIDEAWTKLRFTLDPIPTSLKKGAEDAKAVGLLDGGTNLSGIYDLRILNALLKATGRKEVEGF